MITWFRYKRFMLFSAWYDGWPGYYVNRKKCFLYVGVPWLHLRIYYGPKTRIQNDKQFQVSLQQLAFLQEQLRFVGLRTDIAPKAREAEILGIQSLIDELQEDIQNYR